MGFAGHIEIEDNVTIAAQSGVSKKLASKGVYFGCPAKPIMQAKREEAALRRLPALLKKVAELEQKLVTKILHILTYVEFKKIFDFGWR